VTDTKTLKAFDEDQYHSIVANIEERSGPMTQN